MANLSETVAVGVDVENSEDTVERLADEGETAVAADGDGAQLVRGGERDDRLPAAPSRINRDPGGCCTAAAVSPLDRDGRDASVG